MHIYGKITGIKYTPLFALPSLKEVVFDGFDVNNVPRSCIVKDGNYTFAVSRWVSPKRTRSYPFERVYDTLNVAKKITVIPVVKDEGINGDRDYIQWDTVSLMSLLDVFVIFAHYDKAEINKRNPKKLKITNQQFNNEFIKTKIKEIEQYHSSALHWNLNELKTKLHFIVDCAADAYRKIEKITGIKLHDKTGIENFKNKIGNDISIFMNFSRDKSKQAQAREIVTIQPKESLQTLSKATITIENYLGGQYFLTADEIKTNNKELHIIESKHSKNSRLPSIGDIKDGLLKMILFSNMSNVSVDGQSVKYKAILALTSPKIKGQVYSSDTKNNINSFILKNKFNTKQSRIITNIFEEATKNNFIVQIQFSQNDD
ncbi:MAG: hypothetical protein LBU34_11070 [Planctomycetaceae bacterium]|jgi:hypothetical protein|nr:hypothetical protein [Planctomycetaceae bacterium]